VWYEDQFTVTKQSQVFVESKHVVIVVPLVEFFDEK
jgi:hypothetical protein